MNKLIPAFCLLANSASASNTQPLKTTTELPAKSQEGKSAIADSQGKGDSEYSFLSKDLKKVITEEKDDSQTGLLFALADYDKE